LVQRAAAPGSTYPIMRMTSESGRNGVVNSAAAGAVDVSG